MKKLVVLIFSFLVLFFSGCASGLGFSPNGYTMAISPSMLTSSIQKQFPQKKKFDYGSVELRDPDLGFVKGSDELNVGIAFGLSNPLIPTQNGSVKLSGGIDFDPKSGQFFLKDPKINELKFNNSSLTSLLPSDVKSILKVVVSEILKQTPIYKLDKNSFTGMLVKDVKIDNGKLLVTFGL